MEVDGSLSQPAVSAEAPTEGGEQNDSHDMLTISQTDDQEMGLAVAILEFIGSQPHVQATKTQSSSECHDGDENQQVQVLQISQGDSQHHGLTEDMHTQGESIISILTEIGESEKDAIHAVETLVQIGHTGQQHHVGQLEEQPQAEHVVIHFEPGQGTDGQDSLVTTSVQEEEMSVNRIPTNSTVFVDSSSMTAVAGAPPLASASPLTSAPPPRRIALPPVTHTTTSHRTRLKVRKKADKSVETKGGSTAALKSLQDTSQPEGSVQEVTERSSSRTRHAEKKAKRENNEEKAVQKINPRKRNADAKEAGGQKEKRPKKMNASNETQNNNQNSVPSCDLVDQPSEDKESIVCPTCSQPFTRKDNLKVHMRKQHQAELGDKSVNKLTCFHPECTVSIYHTSKMIEHMEKEHGLVYQKQDLEFESLEEFKRWKEEEEASKFVQFTSSSKEKVTGQGIKSLYFKCQRDGNDKPHRKKGLPGRKTNRKTNKGSVKSNIWCPARISAKLNTKTGRVSALYIQSHSHPISFEDTKHHRIPELLRKEILAKFARGISIEEIYKGLHKPRDRENNVAPLVNKQHFVSKRFLYMLQTKATASKKLHGDERMSVKLLVEKLKSDAFNPVLMFKAAGETQIEGENVAAYIQHIQHLREDAYILFLQTKEQLMLLEKCGSKMICVDATHASNTWGIQLVSLFVTDDYQNGYPVAYLVTNHIDDNILLAFIIAIKHRCPKFTPSLVMTDDDNTGLAQFEEIYGEGSFRHMLSTWHIHQSWLRQLKHHVPALLMRQEMYHCLMLLYEEKNVKRFELMSNMFLCHYSEKCPIFTDYFQLTYASRPTKWALCHLTLDNPVDSSCMFQDNFHEMVKNFYTQRRKSNKRVDVLINILLEIAKNDTWCRNSKEFQQKMPKDSSGTRFLTNHQRSSAIPSENVKEEGKPDSLWKVTTESPKAECHEVRKVKEMCDGEFCYHKCLELSCFGLCRHLYSCSCVEEAQLCQHIHRVHTLRIAQAAMLQVPPHMQTDHLDFGPTVVELSCAETEVNDNEYDDENGEAASQIENLKQQCQEMFSLLKDGRVRQLLLQHVCGTITDLVSTCEAVKAGAVTVTYEQPVEQSAAAEQIIFAPNGTETQSQ